MTHQRNGEVADISNIVFSLIARPKIPRPGIGCNTI